MVFRFGSIYGIHAPAPGRLKGRGGAQENGREFLSTALETLAWHSKLGTVQRNESWGKFVNGRARVLVMTNVGSCGLDGADCTHAIVASQSPRLAGRDDVTGSCLCFGGGPGRLRT